MNCLNKARTIFSTLIAACALILEGASLNAEIASKLDLRYNVGKNIAQVPHYGTAALFNRLESCYCPLVGITDLRVHYSKDHEWAYNVGLGVRYPCNSCLCFGINCFYDGAHFHKNLQQLGLGIEVLGDCFEFRANGYLPIAQKESIYSTRTFVYPEGEIARCRETSRTMKGFDFECGRGFSDCMRDHSIYLGLGGYFYQPPHSRSVVGIRARVEGEWRNLFKCGAIVTRDDRFNTGFQVYVGLSFPFGRKCYDSVCYPCCCESSCNKPIYRQEWIVRNKKCCKWNTNY